MFFPSPEVAGKSHEFHLPYFVIAPFFGISDYDFEIKILKDIREVYKLNSTKPTDGTLEKKDRK